MLQARDKEGAHIVRVGNQYVTAVLTVIALALVMLAVNPWISSAGRISETGTPTMAGAYKEGASPEPQ